MKNGMIWKMRTNWKCSDLKEFPHREWITVAMMRSSMEICAEYVTMPEIFTWLYLHNSEEWKDRNGWTWLVFALKKWPQIDQSYIHFNSCRITLKFHIFHLHGYETIW